MVQFLPQAYGLEKTQYWSNFIPPSPILTIAKPPYFRHISLRWTGVHCGAFRNASSQSDPRLRRRFSHWVSCRLLERAVQWARFGFSQATLHAESRLQRPSAHYACGSIFNHERSRKNSISHKHGLHTYACRSCRSAFHDFADVQCVVTFTKNENRKITTPHN